MKSLFLSSILLFALQSFAEGPTLERIMGYHPGNNSLSFQVHSGGCTDKESFEVKVLRRPNLPSEVYLQRVLQDPCWAFLPAGTQIHYQLEEIGIDAGEPYIIKNPNGVIYPWHWIE